MPSAPVVTAMASAVSTDVSLSLSLSCCVRGDAKRRGRHATSNNARRDGGADHATDPAMPSHTRNEPSPATLASQLCRVESRNPALGCQRTADTGLECSVTRQLVRNAKSWVGTETSLTCALTLPSLHPTATEGNASAVETSLPLSPGAISRNANDVITVAAAEASVDALPRLAAS